MAFDASKREILHKLQQVIDKSPKGSVDAPIVDMIERLNAHPDFVTCSSCSGRIAVFCGVAQSEDEDSHLITKGGKWLVSSHAPVSFEEFHDSVLADPAILQGLVIFKHEPFIMHVQCRDENAARVLLQCGLACGFRESGIVLGNKRTMVAIRTTANAMEIPIAHQGKLMVDTAYLKWILDIANEKFHANRVKTDKLFAAMLTTLFQPTATNLTSIAAGSMPSLSVSRVGHASVIRENRVFIIGGQGPTATNTGRLSDLVLLDTVSNQLSLSMPLTLPARMYHSAVSHPIHRDAVVVFGGRASPSKAFGELWLVNSNGESVQLEAAGSAPDARWSHTSVLVGNKMIVFGGRNASHVFNDVYILSFESTPPTWRAVGSVDLGRFRHAAVAVQKQVFVFGGYQNLDSSHEIDMNSCQVFDTVTETWSTQTLKGDVPSPRASAAVCVIEEQHVVLTGGSSSTAQCHQDIYTLDLRTRTWKSRPALDLDAMLVNHTLAYDSTKKTIFVLGGGCQCFGFGAIYSPTYAITVESKAVETTPTHHQVATSTKKASNQDQLVVVIPKPQVKATKTLLESLQFYDKSRRIQPLDGKANGQYFTVPVFDNIKAQVPPALKEYSITPVQLATAPPSHEDEVTSIAQPDAAVQPEDGAANLENVESPKIDEPLFAVVVGKDQVKTIKTHLELLSLYDKSRRIHPHDSDGLFAVPVLTSSFPLSDPIIGELEVILNTSCEVKPVLNPAVVVLDLLKSFATRHDLASVPTKIEFVADVLVLPKNTCLEPAWNSEDATQLWQDVCEKSPISVKRIARSADVDLSEKRQSHVELLYVHPSFVVPTRGVGWVEVRENGLKYAWDIQKVMFSSGNVTEKARMAKIGCAGETIVDMYAGIGYYVIPFLVHGKAAHVHALEWNPDSVDALRYNLERNRVSSRCTVYPGDNRISGPTLGAIADRVNLGLLPKSEHGWPVAVQVLKPSGGWLHVHENVAVEDITAWQEHVVKSIQELGRSIGKHWKVECAHLERVKSYAPKVYHLVADIHCTPLET
ncbi:unnamed protein product [Aphanomyces euteiches]|nr:hypothetical protein AeRB84_006810 [Aphanomyces euteiches]